MSEVRIVLTTLLNTVLDVLRNLLGCPLQPSVTHRTRLTLCQMGWRREVRFRVSFPFSRLCPESILAIRTNPVECLPTTARPAGAVTHMHTHLSCIVQSIWSHHSA